MSDRPKLAVLVFPGSNDDRDAAWALAALGADAELERMCDQLLTNPLIESYEIEVAP